MTKEDKQLFLKDICARLPYGIQALRNNQIRVLDDLNAYGQYTFAYWDEMLNIERDEVKPFLRSMSSMTEKEKEVLNRLVYNSESGFLSPIPVWVINESNIDKYVDFCNSHHLDWRGLIEKGLALEAPKDMYKTE